MANVDFKSVINLALSNKVPWNPIKTMLHELTPTFEASKELNDVLIEELEFLHSKQNGKVQISKSNESDVLQFNDLTAFHR